MTAWLKIIGVAVVVVAVLAAAGWRTVARLQDCETLGHGALYCLVVWGGR